MATDQNIDAPIWSLEIKDLQEGNICLYIKENTLNQSTIIKIIITLVLFVVFDPVYQLILLH